MDGPAFVTQCPIVPGNTFLYALSSFNCLMTADSMIVAITSLSLTSPVLIGRP